MTQELTAVVRAEIRNAYQYALGTTKWCILLALHDLSRQPEPTQMKEYEVWVHGEYLVANGMDASLGAAKQFALDLIRKRFDEVGRKIPDETGAITDGSQIHYGPRENFPMGLSSWND